MYSGQKYLSSLTDERPARGQDNNSQASGGFPHSEIRGSKGALPSPRLIAECHVLHRLLSPRHSPNALHALDPIQKTQDPQVAPPASAPEPLSQPARAFCLPGRSRSVHRLGKTAFAARIPAPRPGVTPEAAPERKRPDRPPLGTIRKSVSCFSLFTMSKTIKVQTNECRSGGSRRT